MTDTAAANPLNGQAQRLAAGAYDAMIVPPRKSSAVTQPDHVLGHLLIHGVITPDEAWNLFRCAVLTPAITRLRDRGWVIETRPAVDENGRPRLDRNGEKYSSYHLLDKTQGTPRQRVQRRFQRRSPALGPSQGLADNSAPSLFTPSLGDDPLHAEAQPAPPVEPVLASVTAAAPTPGTLVEDGVVHVRFGSQGSGIQIVSANDTESSRFFRLSPSLIRHLKRTLDVFTDLDEDNRR